MNQFLFILSIFVLGLCFSELLFPELKSIIRYYVSPFVGIGFMSLAVGLLIVIGSPVTLQKVGIILIGYWLMIYFSLRHSQCIPTMRRGLFMKSLNQYININFIGVFISYFLIVIIFVLIGKSSTVSDSTQFEGIGRFLANGGTIDDQPPLLSFLLNGRLLVVGAMHCLNRLFGSYSLYALYPTFHIWFLGFIILSYSSLRRHLSSNNKIPLLLLLVFIMFSNKSFNYQIYHVHSNGLAMIFCSISIMSLYLFKKSKNKSWLIFGSFILGISTLIRIDNLIFSIIFFSIAFKIIYYDRRLITTMWVIFLIISLPWWLFTLSYTPLKYWHVNAYQIIILIAANVVFAIVSVFIPKYYEKKLSNFPFLFMIGTISFVVVMLYQYPQNVEYAFRYFLFQNLLSQNWIFLTFTILLMTIFLPYVAQIDNDIVILPYSILLYISQTFLIVLFSSIIGQSHVASRNLYHIVPLYIFWVFLSFSTVIDHSKNNI